jgi:hypothetical protein
MPNYFYIKNGGTEAAGDDTVFSTRQTGTWAGLATANVYGNLLDAQSTTKTTDPTVDDFFVMAQGHSNSASGNHTFSLAGAHLIVVDESNIETAVKATAANEDIGANANIYITNGGSTTKKYYYEQCTFESPTSGDRMYLANVEPCHVTMVDCDIKMGGAANQLHGPTRGSILKMIGGTIQGTSTTSAIYALAGVAGAQMYLSGVTITGIATNLLYGMSAYGLGLLRMDGCVFDSTLDYVRSAATLIRGQVVHITNSGNTDDVSRQFYYRDGQDIAEDSVAYVRDNSEPFTVDATKSSIKITTAATTSIHDPFFFQLPARFVEMATSSTDALKFYLASSDASLTNADISFRVGSRDATDEYTLELVETGTVPWETGTSLTSSGEAWTPTTLTEYEVVADTAGSSADGVPDVWVRVNAPSFVGYLCTEFDVTGV